MYNAGEGVLIWKCLPRSENWFQGSFQKAGSVGSIFVGLTVTDLLHCKASEIHDEQINVIFCLLTSKISVASCAKAFQ